MESQATHKPGIYPLAKSQLNLHMTGQNIANQTQPANSSVNNMNAIMAKFDALKMSKQGKIIKRNSNQPASPNKHPPMANSTLNTGLRNSSQQLNKTISHTVNSRGQGSSLLQNNFNSSRNVNVSSTGPLSLSTSAVTIP